MHNGKLTVQLVSYNVSPYVWYYSTRFNYLTVITRAMFNIYIACLTYVPSTYIILYIFLIKMKQN